MRSLQAMCRGSVECLGSLAACRREGFCFCSLLEDEDEDEDEELTFGSTKFAFWFVFSSTKCEGWFAFGSARNLFVLLALPDLLPASADFLIHSRCFSRSNSSLAWIKRSPIGVIILSNLRTTVATTSADAPLSKRDSFSGSAGMEPSRQQ